MLDESALKASLKPTKECLPPHQLERAAADPAVQDPHLATCARCQAEVELLKAFQADVALPDEGAAVGWITSEVERRFDEIRNPARARERAKRASHKGASSTLSRLFGLRKIRLLVPAAVFALTAAAFIVLRPGQEPAIRVPVNAGSTILRSEEIQTVGASGQLMQAPSVLQWTPVTGAQRYQVVVMEVDRSPLWTAETTESSVAFPAGVRGKFLARKPVLWQVTALGAQGRRLASSQLQRFVVVPGKQADPAHRP